MNTYELAVLYHPDLEIDLEKASQKIEKIITDNKGKIKNEDNWGKRRMAYKIKGHDHAVYVFYTIEIPPLVVKKLEASLNITEEVIRFLIVKPDYKAKAKIEAIKAGKKAKKAEALKTKPKTVEKDEKLVEEPKKIAKTVKPKVALKTVKPKTATKNKTVKKSSIMKTEE